MKLAVFLGGGASAAEGAPMQTELFREYFKCVQNEADLEASEMYQELKSYFKEIFDVDIASSNIDNLNFPTFEEALGILDLAVRRREALKNFDLENICQNSNRIGFMRQYLVLLVASVLTYKERHTRGLHKSLVRSLKTLNLLDNTIFITTNYDLLIDNALAALPDRNLDYGLSFNHIPDKYRRNDGDTAISLYKVHGSLNWLYCPACNTINLTGDRSGIVSLPGDNVKYDCTCCRSIMLPVIVPPTFFKDMSNVFLNMVWNKAEASLRDAEHIIFCGYSFPDADMHVKYLLKRIQTNRASSRSLKIDVVNNHPGKNVHLAEKEMNRYRRFLGANVNYTPYSFADFAKNPAIVL